MGCRTGSTKCEKGEIKTIGNVPKPINIWRSMAFGNQVSVYDDLVVYMNICEWLQPGLDKFLIQPNDQADVKRRRIVITRLHFVKHSSINLIKISFQRENLSGEGIKDYITMHCTTSSNHLSLLLSGIRTIKASTINITSTSTSVRDASMTSKCLHLGTVVSKVFNYVLFLGALGITSNLR